MVNDTFIMEIERAPGCAPVYKRQGGPVDGIGDVWLFLASDNTWYVSNTEAKDARRPGGVAATADAVAAGTLPHEAVGTWLVSAGGGKSAP